MVAALEKISAPVVRSAVFYNRTSLSFQVARPHQRSTFGHQFSGGWWTGECWHRSSVVGVQLSVGVPSSIVRFSVLGFLRDILSPL